MRYILTPRELSIIQAAHLAPPSPLGNWQSVGRTSLLFDVDGTKVCLRRNSRNADFNTPKNNRVEIWRYLWLNWALKKAKASKQHGDRRHGGYITHAQKEVLRALVSFVDPRRPGIIDPSFTALAARAKTARSTAQLCIAHSILLGLVKKVRRYLHWDTGHGIVAVQDTNAYILVVPRELEGVVHDTESRSVVASPVNNIKKHDLCQAFDQTPLGQSLQSLNRALTADQDPPPNKLTGNNPNRDALAPPGTPVPTKSLKNNRADRGNNDIHRNIAVYYRLSTSAR